MDNVLVDFDRGAAAAHGVSIEAVNAERFALFPGQWDLLGPIGYAKGLGRALTIYEFWEPIHERGEAFWTDLLPLFWNGSARDMPTLLTDVLGLPFHVVSAPSRLACSYSGKVKWLKDYFGQTFDRFAITPHKELFARDNTVLIDDREENCEKFTKAGGLAILFPSLGNALYHYADNPLPYVQHCLNQL